MTARENALNQWLERQFPQQPFTLTPLAGDASFRRYFRLQRSTETLIVMDAPPTHEAIIPFMDIGQRLQHIGVRTPTIHAVDLEQGFALLDDLGDTLLLQAITPVHQDPLYFTAINTLIQLQQCSISAPLPDFNRAHMLQEMALFKEWFLKAYLKLTLSPSDEQLIDTTCHWLASHVSEQPSCFIHRDYHSRNLMVLENQPVPQLGVIDFQDAMRGPVTYDLVSLLKDCYIKLSVTAFQTYASYFYDHQPLVHGWSFDTFLDEVDYCGLQRHLKVLGIFCRLFIRDQKPGYLNDLPLTLDYTLTCLRSHHELEPLFTFMTERVLPRFNEVIPA